MGKNLNSTKTHENLKAAFAGESQANRRYLYFAKQADVEGRPDLAGLFRDTAEGETGHAHGHLEYLQEVGDPATGEPIGATNANLKELAAVASQAAYVQLWLDTTYGPNVGGAMNDGVVAIFGGSGDAEGVVNGMTAAAATQ